MTETLGRENLKLSTSQVSAMVNLLRKEADQEFEEKIKIKEVKEEEKNSVTENETESGKTQTKETVKAEEKPS